jgi:hypothetical protein
MTWAVVECQLITARPRNQPEENAFRVISPDFRGCDK